MDTDTLQTLIPAVLMVLTLSGAIGISVVDLYSARKRAGLNPAGILAALAPALVVGAFWTLLLHFAPLFR